MGFLRGLGKIKLKFSNRFILAELVVTFVGCEVWLNINELFLCAGDGVESRRGCGSVRVTVRVVLCVEVFCFPKDFLKREMSHQVVT